MIKKSKILSGSILMGMLVFSSCTKDDDEMVTVEPTTTEDSYTVPLTYTFVDGNGASTVSFSGQLQRLDMLSEMVTYMKSANTAGTSVDATTLKNMYANSGYTWMDENSLGMTGSSKQLKSKTAAGDVGVQAMFEGYMDDIAAISTGSTTNSNQSYGTAGVWTNGAKSYLQDANGKEYTQLIEKGLMCAVFMNQMTDNYLGTLVDDDNETLVEGKTYTEMQHHWDEAYGYFTSEIDYPAAGTDRFWGKYANGREALLGSATAIVEAFRKGRAAIDNKDYTTRDEQVAVIRNEMEKVCAGTAIHYLNEWKTASDNTIKNHVLSEAEAFLNGLRYGSNAIEGVGMVSADIDTALGYFSDYENVSVANINAAIDLIASKTGLESVKANL